MENKKDSVFCRDAKPDEIIERRGVGGLPPSEALNTNRRGVDYYYSYLTRSVFIDI